ncbi:MAG TPA: peptidoglycan-binding protein, partial [Terriglobia bacterium]
MSVSKSGLILFSSFLIFAMAPLAPAQQTSHQDTNTTTTQQQTQKKTTAWKENKTKSGMSHNKVRETQAALKKDGFDPGPIDGVMGPMTMTALRNYQLWNHLEETGTLTAETRDSLMNGTAARTSRLENNNQAQPNSNQSQTYVNPSETQPSTAQAAGATAGQSNVANPGEVKDTQQALLDLGYAPGDVNGMMSSDTQEAVRQFQWFNDLPVTGVLDQQTKTEIDLQEQGGTENAQLGASPLPDQERQKPGITSSNEQTNSQDQIAQNTTADNSSYNEKTTKHHERKYDKEAAERAEKSASVLRDLTAASDNRIPDDILQRAQAIAVIPHMIKGAFGIGGDFGKGMVAERTDGGRWSAPAFISIGGGSFGAQLGVEATDLVLVFTSRDALDLLEKGTDVKLGADASVA